MVCRFSLRTKRVKVPLDADLGAAAIAHVETRTKLEMHRIFTFMMRKQTRLIKIRVKLLTTSISERSTAKDARSRTASPFFVANCVDPLRLPGGERVRLVL